MLMDSMGLLAACLVAAALIVGACSEETRGLRKHVVAIVRYAAIQLRVLLAARAVRRRMQSKCLPYAWFDGIADWKVNEMARTRIDDGDEASQVAEIIRAARAERNRRYPARVGLPASTATRRWS